MAMQDVPFFKRGVAKRNAAERETILNRTLASLRHETKTGISDENKHALLKAIYIIYDYMINVMDDAQKIYEEKEKALMAAPENASIGDILERHYSMNPSEIKNKIDSLVKEKEEYIDSRLGENFPLTEILNEKMNDEEREVLKSFVKYVERKLEVAYGEKFELITQDYHQMLEEFIQNLNDVSKKTLNGSLNDRRDIKSELERMDKIIKEYKSTQDEDKKEKLRDSYERAKMMYNVSVGMLLEKLPELIVNKVLVDIAKKTLEQTQNKKR
jgi:hypothetical protein